jgi:C-terminal processing protease CtpA/Prc
LMLLPHAAMAAGGQPFVIHETYAQALSKIERDTKNSHGVVGLDLLIQKGHYPIVEGIFQGTPAAVQGLLPGDMILAVNGVSTLHKNLAQVDSLISDVPGDRVVLTVQRGQRLSQVRLTVAALEELSPNLRAEFSGMFGGGAP